MNTTPTRDFLQIRVRDMIASPRNVRRGERGGIAELADQIAAAGLLHAPTVVPVEIGRGKKARTAYETIAGERRRQAMLRLIEQGRWAPDAEIGVNLAEAGEATAVSLTENLSIEAMHPVDACEAFRALIETDGHSIADVAARFGISEVTVRRRLQLAKLAPALLEAYRAGDIDAAQLAALSLTDDHALQLQTWEQAPAWNRDPRSLRAVLMQARCCSTTDPVARWVGLSAYEAAGGALRRDLFSDEGDTYLDDVALLDRLAVERLEDVRREVEAEGWGWVSVQLRLDRQDLAAYGALPRQRREPNAEEAQRLATLRQRADTLEAEIDALYDADERDEVKLEACERELDNCTGEIDQVEESLLSIPEDLMAHAGAIVTLDARGPAVIVQVHRGRVRPDQRAALATMAVSIGLGADAARPSGQAAPRPAYSEALMQRLTAHRTAALQAEVAAAPHIGLALITARLTAAWWGCHSAPRDGVEVQVRCTRDALEACADDLATSRAGRALAERREGWEQRLRDVPEDGLLDFLVAQPASDLLQLLALGVALTLDTVQARTAAHRGAQALSRVTGLDMASWWSPSAAGFLAHVPKARLVEIVAEAVSAEAAAPLAALKKAEAVARAEALLTGSGWLPEPLRIANPAA